MGLRLREKVADHRLSRGNGESGGQACVYQVRFYERESVKAHTLHSAAYKKANLVRDQGTNQVEDAEYNHGNLEDKLLAEDVPETATDHKEATILYGIATRVSG